MMVMVMGMVMVVMVVMVVVMVVVVVVVMIITALRFSVHTFFCAVDRRLFFVQPILCQTFNLLKESENLTQNKQT